MESNLSTDSEISEPSNFSAQEVQKPEKLEGNEDPKILKVDFKGPKTAAEGLGGSQNAISDLGPNNKAHEEEKCEVSGSAEGSTAGPLDLGPDGPRPCKNSGPKGSLATAMLFGQVAEDYDDRCSEGSAAPSTSELWSPGSTASRSFWSESGSWILSKFRSQDQKTISSPTTESCLREPTVVERNNLLNISKLVVKELIEFCLRHGRTLEPDHPPLQHFLIVLEHCLRHALKPKKGLLGPKKELWDVLQLVEKYTDQAVDITNTIRELPTVRTHLGRARAFLRLALMQKKLADYFKVLVEVREEALVDFYEPCALMLSDEAVVLAGLLVGLNVIDCNFCLKEEELDVQQGVIDFSLYLRSTRSSDSGGEEDSHAPSAAAIDHVLDQKNYIEELNRHLNATVSNLQGRVESLTTTNALLSEDLAISKKMISQLQEEKKELLKQRQSQPLNLNAPAKASPKTAETSTESSQPKKEAEEEEKETSLSQLQSENKILRQRNVEMEEAMQWLEKDVQEKQDTVISLRKQLDDIKAINLEMYKKLQECESSVRFKSELADKLEDKVKLSDDTIRKLDEKVSNVQTELRVALQDSRTVCAKLAEKELQLSTVEGDLLVEREWRISLEEQLAAEKDRVNQLSEQLDEEHTKQKNFKLTIEIASDEVEMLRRQCAEQEQALEEMALKVRDTTLLADEMRDLKVGAASARWKSDSEGRFCFQCQKKFQLTTRKHHCRSCGEIFCSDCSDKVMELPSNSKPVRVCDACYTNRLQKCSVK